MGDFRDLNTGHAKERTCRAVAEAGLASWMEDYEAKADLLTLALELFIQQELNTLQAIMTRAESLSGTPKECGKAFQALVRDVLGG